MFPGGWWGWGVCGGKLSRPIPQVRELGVDAKEERHGKKKKRKSKSLAPELDLSGMSPRGKCASNA